MEEQIFKTSETPLAAFLVTEGYTVLDVIYNGKTAFFLFANGDDKFQEDVKNFQLIKAMTNASQLIDNYQRLINRAKRGY